MPQDKLSSIWKTVLGELEVELGKSNFGLYFKGSLLLSLDDGVAKIGFPNKAVADQANQRYYSLIQASLQKIAKKEKLSLVFEISERIAESGERIDDTRNQPGPLFEEPKIDKEEIQAAIKRANLRSDFTFEEFCVSTSNQLAFAAAQAVARDPGKNYNPLFIWGGVGVGKTHLMQAIGHEILRKNPRTKVYFAPGEQFLNEIIAAIRASNTQSFKDKYRSADVLLIDDIQFLSGKESAQEEFFHTFNAVQQREGQIIMTSDRKPHEIKDLTDRLRSRFEGGLVADISTPDSELKTAICILKAKKRGIELSTNLAGLITSNVDNIRTLDGTLQRLLSEVAVNKTELTEELVIRILQLPSPTGSPSASKIDNRTILDIVCQFYNLPMKIIKGTRRDKSAVEPRQVLMYLLKRNTSMTLEEIAAFIGGRDHTTVMHGIKKIELLQTTNERLRSDLLKLQENFLL